MYYIIFPFLYLLSLMPFFVIYGISDGIAFLLFHVFKYRRDVVMNNLAIAFPEKSDAERVQIAKRFYLYFTDTLLESLKFISLSKKQLLKRGTGNFDIVNELAAKGHNINLMAGHQFNWEFVNHLTAIKVNIPFIGIYMPISNKVLNRVFIDIRKRYGTVLISATEFKTKMHAIFNEQFSIGLAADQNPGDPRSGYWIRFFNRPVPFVTGPEKGAVKNNAAVVYVSFKKVKRGYYHFECSLLAESPAGLKEGELTCLYRDKLEQTIKADPANYLWSHRRFKFEWTPEYGEIIG